MEDEVGRIDSDEKINLRHDHGEGGHDHGNSGHDEEKGLSPLKGPGYKEEGHEHQHDERKDNKMGKLCAVIFVCLLFMTIEIIGGLIAHSLAILTDAAHLFSDLAGIGISIFAIWIGQKKASSEFSYGWGRAEVVGALASTILIWGLTVWL